MKLRLNIILFLFALFIIGDKSFSLTDYQIKKICKQEKRETFCIRYLKEKRFNLQKGNIIEIPIQPYRK